MDRENEASGVAETSSAASVGEVSACSAFFARGFFALGVSARAFQPASSFKAGYPSDYTIGEVSDKFKQDYVVIVARG